MESSRKRGRSDMWGHFKLIALDKVQCLLCLGVYKYHGNTSSMIRHFSTQHRAVVNQENANQVEQKQDQKEDQKQDPDEALVKMVVKESQPLSIVDSLLLSDSVEQPTKRGRSDMWEHFNLILPDKVQCVLCLGVYKYHGNTSSMIRHFSTQHRALVNQGHANQVDQKQDPKEDHKEDPKQDQKEDQKHDHKEDPKQDQKEEQKHDHKEDPKQDQKEDQKEDRKQYQKHVQKQDPDEALVKMMVKESQPLSIVDSLLLSDSAEQPRKRGRSDMWEHFNLILPDKVQCSVCLAVLKYHGNTSSMIRHYTTKHKAAFIQGKKNKDDRKRKLDEALVNMLVKDSQPFSIVDDCGFKEFVALLDPTYTLPSPRTLEDMVIKRFNEQMTKVKDNVEGGRSGPKC